MPGGYRGLHALLAVVVPCWLAICAAGDVLSGFVIIVLFPVLALGIALAIGFAANEVFRAVRPDACVR